MENIKNVNEDFEVKSEKMSKKKKIVLAVCFVLVIVGITALAVNINTRNRIKNVKENSKQWKTEAITSPKEGSLQAAGYITINWNAADSMGEVEKYKIYVNDEVIAETDGKTTTCEYYTTEVAGHKVYVEANLKHGSKIYSDIKTFYVNKKGLCVNKDMAQNIEAPDWGVSWYYDWNMEALKYTSFQDLQFVPMMWTSSPTDEKTISRFHKFGYKYVLAFNEPDHIEQSNLTVDEAVEGMKAFMNQNIMVGSPATALCPPWSGSWFQPFMEKMEEEGMDVDFIPIHHYWNWFDEEGAKAFLDLVKESYEMYKKPIWITEFAISGDPGKTPEQRQKVIDYMKMVLPELDKLEYVERYAWFSFNPEDYQNGASSLIQYYKGDITDLGYLYQDLGMPEGYGDKNVKTSESNPNEDIIK